MWGLSLFISLPAISVPVLPISGQVCISSGEAVSDQPIDGCGAWSVTDGGGGLNLVSAEFEFSDLVTAGGDIAAPLNLQLIFIQFDSSLTTSDVVDPSPGFLGVDLWGPLWGALWSVDCNPCEISFGTTAPPIWGSTAAFGSTGTGALFTFTNENFGGMPNAPVDGNQPFGSFISVGARPGEVVGVSEPPGVLLSGIALVLLAGFKTRHKRWQHA